jgi:hypothetical protein
MASTATTTTMRTEQTVNRPMYWSIGALMVALLIAIFFVGRRTSTTSTQTGTEVTAPAANTMNNGVAPMDTQPTVPAVNPNTDPVPTPNTQANPDPMPGTNPEE